MQLSNREHASSNPLHTPFQPTYFYDSYKRLLIAIGIILFVSFTLGLSLPTQAATNVVLPDPTHHWTFDEGTGNAANDTGTAGNNPGTFTNGASWTTGIVGTAVLFADDGGAESDDLVSLASTVTMAGDWTIALWVRRDMASSENDPMILDQNGSERLGIVADRNDSGDAVAIRATSGANADSSYQLPIGQWVHLSFVRTGGNIEFYVDGAYYETLPHNSDTRGFVAFGDEPGGNVQSMIGALDDARVYNGTALTTTQVQDLYNSYDIQAKFYYTQIPPVIDGQREPAWNIAPVYTAANVSEGSLGPADDNVPEFQGMYDNNNLYFFLKVVDDTIISDSGINFWYKDDAVAFFIDGDNSKQSSYDGVNDFELIFNTDNLKRKGINSEDLPSGLVHQLVEDGDHYRIEVSIPITELDISPVSGTVFGFDFGSHDDDQGGWNRDARVEWFGTTNETWENPSLFGVAKLVVSNQLPILIFTDTVTLEENNLFLMDIETTDDTDAEGSGLTYSLSGPDAGFFTLNPTSGEFSLNELLDYENPHDANTDNVYVVDINVADSEPVTNTKTFSLTITNVTEGGTVEFFHTAIPPVIDGEPDAVWDTTPVYTATQISAGYLISATDNRASLRGLYDNEYLYLFVNVEDDIIINDGPIYSQDDAVDIYIDGNNSRQSTYDSVDDLELIFQANGIYTQGPNSIPSPAALNGFTVLDANSYRLEVAIPITGININPIDNFQFGFDFGTQDDDQGGGTRQARTQWNDTTNNAYFNPSVWGTARLKFVNQPPIIVTSEIITVDENSLLAVDIEGFDDVDVEGGDLDFQLTGGLDQAAFTLGDSYGILDFNSAPNFEAPHDRNGDNVYVVEVTLEDSESLIATKVMSITVVNVNEAPEITTPTGNAVNMDENTNAVTNLSATDDSDSEGSGLGYSLGAGTDAGYFTISTATGQLDFISAPDYETPLDGNGDNIYTVEVIVTDSGGLTDTHMVNVVVDDVYENTPPTITSTNTVSIDENTTGVLNMSATDDADVEGDGLEYTLSGGADQSLFNIITETGRIEFLNAPDYEIPTDANTDNVYVVEVTLTDTGGLTDKQTISVTVDDVYENVAPTFTSANSISMDENVLVVTDVNASDDVDSEGSGLTYGIFGGDDQALFFIDPPTGELTFLSAPDYELPTDNDTNNVYLVSIIVTDSGGLTDTQPLNITVDDVYENTAPTITTANSVSMDENQTDVLNIESSDDVDSEGSGLTYSISGGADQSLFTIDANTGQLDFINAPDFDSPGDATGDNVYVVDVTVADSGGGAGSLVDTQTINVTITDINENDPPSITTANSVTVDENQTAVLDIATTDDNDSEGAGLTYTISGGADQAAFMVDAATGVLSFVIAPDYETPADTNGDNVYVVDVTVTDSGTLNDIQTINVTVDDVFENTAPSITTADSISMDENTTAVLDVESSDDVDSEGSGLTYSLIGGDDQTRFAIDANTGVLAFTSAPDFDTPGDANGDNVYLVMISVVDTGALSDTQTISVTITDINENDPPSFTSANSVAIDENGTAVLDVQSSDDNDSEGSGLTYALAGGSDQSKFAVDATTGVLTFIAAPDYETPLDSDSNNIYAVDIRVTDSGGLNVTQSINVTVNDVNENTAPSITTASSVSLDENNTAVLDVDASDDSDAEGSGLTYSLTGGADQGLFTIDGNTGQLSFISAPDFDSPSDANGDNVYAVDVTVTDSAGAVDTQSINVTVTDINENDAPSITSANSVTIDENTTAVLDVEATDDNDSEGSGLNYSLNGGADLTFFEIDSATGVLTFVDAPDFENPADTNGDNVYVVDIIVIDSGSLSQIQTINVTVSDVNENTAPIITSDSVVSINEGTTIAQNVQASDGQDSEGDGLTFSLDGGADQGIFTIDADTGRLEFINAPVFATPTDANSDNVYEVVVKVADSEGLTAAQTLNITVLEVAVMPILDAHDATVVVPMNTAVTVDVLADLLNTNLPQADLAVTLVSFPSYGSVMINGDKTIGYEAGPDYTGMDTVRYQVADTAGDSGSSDVALLTFVMDAPENSAPDARDDVVVTPEDTTATLDVLANDFDSDGNTLTVSIVDAPKHGTASVNADYTILYTPTAGYTGPDTMRYQVSDGAPPEPGTDSALVSITVDEPVNNAPVAEDDVAALDQGRSRVISVLANDSDLEGDVLTVSILLPPVIGTATIDPEGAIYYKPPADYAGTDSFLYQIDDGHGGIDAAVVYLTINPPVNNAPNAKDDTFVVLADTDTTLTVLANDSDMDGDPLTVLVTTPPQKGTTVVNSDGSIVYSPHAGETGEDAFIYRITDVDGREDNAIVTIVIDPPGNDAPVANDDNGTTTQNKSAVFDVLANDLDTDGDPLTVKISLLPGHGTARINPDGTIDYTPRTDYAGTDALGYTISDGNGNSAAAMLNITIEPRTYNCDDIIDVSREECLALVEIYRTLNGPDWPDDDFWLRSDQACEWFGTACQPSLLRASRATGEASEAVARLVLPNSNLGGTLPCSVASLTELEHLDLNGNNLSGELPCELSLLVNLKHIDLSNNTFEGEIPPEISALTGVENLFLNGNNFIGGIPVEFGNMTSLKQLDLGGNALDGTIPAELGNLTNLSMLSLQGNKLVGDVPGELTTLSSLFDGGLDIGYNTLTADPTNSGFLPLQDPNWFATQTVPPANLQIQGSAGPMFVLTWTPIDYTGDGGFYEVSIAKSATGPFTLHGNTENSGGKSAQGYTLSDLDYDITYYVRVRTYTPAHTRQSNESWSEYSDIVIAMQPTPSVVQPTPTPAPPPVAESVDYDLSIRYVEFNQAIQTSDNSVPLVAGKPLVARINVGMRGTSGDVEDVTAELRAYRNGVELPESPLKPFNPDGRITAKIAPDRANMDDTLNFAFPESWLAAGHLVVSAILNPNTADQDMSNNALTYQLGFHKINDMEIVLVPIAYQPGGTGQTHRPSLDGSTGYGLGFIQEMYPVANVNYTIHPELHFTGDLYSVDGWKELLTEIQTLRANEMDNPRLISPKYYGVVRVEPGCCIDQGWPVSPSPRVGGLAFRPGGSGVGVEARDYLFSNGENLINIETQIAAHEIGHTWGLPHAPCNVQGDPNFPTTDASINDVGIYMPEMRALATTYKDIMSYCIDVQSTPTMWISAYNYNRLIEFMTGKLIDTLATTVLLGNELPNARTTMARQSTRGSLGGYILTGSGQEESEFTGIGQSRAAKETLGTGWLAQGFVQSAHGTGNLKSALTVESAALVEESQQCSSHELRLVDDNGSPLYSYFFNPTPMHDEGDHGMANPTAEEILLGGDPERHDSHEEEYSYVLPKVEGTARIQLWQGNTFIDECTVASAPPMLTVDMTETATTFDITWAATDANVSDPPWVMVRYTADDGNSWIMIEPEMAASGTLSILKSQLPQSSSGRFEVVANNCTESITEVIEVGVITNTPPRPVIMGDDVQSFRAGWGVVLRGEASDMEDGPIPSEQFVWSSPQLGDLGTGKQLILSNGLAAGSYDIILEVTDSLGLSAQAETTVVIMDEEESGEEEPEVDDGPENGFENVTDAPAPTVTPSPPPPATSSPNPGTVTLSLSTTPAVALGAGSNIQLLIQITNIGDTVITTLPMTQTYDTAYLAYNPESFAVPFADDNVNDGQLNWRDVTGISDLNPGESMTVIVNFVAQQETAGLATAAPCVTAGATCTVVQMGNVTEETVGGRGVTVMPPPAVADATIGDLVWFDINGDGMRDAGEPGMNGVLVNLAGEVDGISQVIAQEFTANHPSTGEGGYYQFDVASGNTYTISISASNFVEGGMLAGLTSTDCAEGRQARVTLDAGASGQDVIDFGCTIKGVVGVEMTPAQSTVTLGETIPIVITVRNNGTIPLVTVPLESQYDAAYVSLASAAGVQPTGNQETGILTWDNVAPAGGIAVGEAVSITLNLATQGVTGEEGMSLNAQVTNALADPDGAGTLGSIALVDAANGSMAVRVREPVEVLDEGDVRVFLPVVMR
ncbi:MAG: Ig-like domain-containing protein [Chloroflexota bacterium]